MDACQIVLCPCPTRGEALSIADTLVQEGLAGAVNIARIDSVHRWRGQVRQLPEYLMMIKSRMDSYDAIEQRIMELHSYELPGIAAVPVTAGADAYLEWIRSGGMD